MDSVGYRRMLNQAVWVPVTALFLVAIILAALVLNLLGVARSVAHTHEVIAQAELTLRLAVDAETGERGYLVGGEPLFLEPYTAAEKQIPAAFDRLSTLVRDNPTQARRVQTIRATFAGFQQFADRVMSERRQGGDYQRLFNTGAGKAIMDDLRGQFTGLIATENQLQEQRARNTERVTWFSLATMAGALALVAGFLAINRRRQITTLSDSYEAALRALAEREGWLSTTLTSIGDGVLTTDAKGNVLFLNPVAEELTGWKLEEAVGQPLASVFRIVNETTRETVANPVMKVLETGKVQGLANHTLLISRSGAERPIDDSAAPIRTGDQLLGVVLVFRDIAARREAERKIEESENRFRVIAEAMPQFVWMVDTQGKMEYINTRWTEYSGLSQEESEERTLASLIHPDDAGPLFTQWAQAQAEGKDFVVETRLRRAADGVYRWFLVRTNAVRDADGRIIRWVGTSTDIEDQKRAEERINILNTRLHRAVYESTHRIKNHLQTLSATVELALLEGRPQVPADEVERFGLQIRTLAALQDILTVEWRADASGSVDTLSSRTLLEKILELLRQAAPNHQLTYTVDDISLSLKAGTSLALVINEAVTNAIKHGRRLVTVTLFREGGFCCLQVEDDGPGFPDGFDPSTDANTGVELIQSLVLHDLSGHVSFENRPEGGASVITRFPLPD